MSGTEWPQAGHTLENPVSSGASAHTGTAVDAVGRDTETATNAHSGTPSAGPRALMFNRTHERSHTGPSTGAEPGLGW